MTGNRGRPDVRLLAALDAGLLDEAAAREVRAAAEADPAARAVLTALAATRAELATLPDPPVPAALAERWSAALAVEQARLAAPAPRPSPSTPRPAAPVSLPPATPVSPRPAARPLANSLAHQPATPVEPPAAAVPLATPPGHQPATPIGPPAAAVPLANPLANPPPATRAESGAPAPPRVRSGADPAAATGPHAVEPASRPPDLAAAAPPAAAASACHQPTASAPTQAGANRSTAPQGHAVELRADPEPTAPPSGPGAAPDARSRRAGRRRGSSSRPQRNPVRRLRRPAVLAAALLVAVAVVAGLRARPEPPPTVERPRLVAEALSTVGVRDTAALADPARRAGCLRAVGAPVESWQVPLLGGRRVTFEGAEGVLLVLGTGRRGAFDVLIVDPDCGPGGGRLFAATRVTPP